jgi:hypothetical protein
LDETLARQLGGYATVVRLPSLWLTPAVAFARTSDRIAWGWQQLAHYCALLAARTDQDILPREREQQSRPGKIRIDPVC